MKIYFKTEINKYGNTTARAMLDTTEKTYKKGPYCYGSPTCGTEIITTARNIRAIVADAIADGYTEIN